MRVTRPTNSLLLLLLLLFVTAPVLVLGVTAALKGLAPERDISIVVYIFLGALIPFLLSFVYFLILLGLPDVAPASKPVWIAVLLLWFPLSGPVFWYFHLWRQRLIPGK